MTQPPPSDRLLSVPKGVTIIRRERRPDDIPERMGFDILDPNVILIHQEPAKFLGLR